MKLLGLLPILLLFVLASCKRLNKEEVAPKVLKVALSRQIDSIDPANSYDLVSAKVLYQVCETLYEYEYLYRPYILRPLLAEEMPVIEKDGLEYTFKLKKNIRYHNHVAFQGKPRYLIAQDFVNQFKRLAFKPLRSSGWWLYEGKIKGLDEFREKAGDDLEKFKSLTVEGLKAVDKFTLKISLKERDPQFLYTLAMTFASPVPLEIIDYYQNNLSNVAIGTGPFKLITWEKGKRIILKRFENYHDNKFPSKGDRYAHDKKLLKNSGKQLPFLDEIDFKVIKEDRPRWKTFLKGDLHFTQVPKDHHKSIFDDFGRLKKEFIKKGYSLHISPTLKYWWLAFNMEDPLIGGNKNLRKAIAHAVDVEKYIKLFTNNVALRANSIYPPGISGYDPGRQLTYGYDLKKALEFLEKAGYPNGKGLPPLTFDLRGSSTTYKQMGDFIKSELKKIGITVNITPNTFPEFLKKARTRKGSLQIWQGGWSLDFPDALNVLQLLYSKNHPPGPNSSAYKNEEFDKGFLKLKTMSSGKQKFQLMKEMENLVLEDIPWVMLYYSREYFLIDPKLKNFRHSDLGLNYYKYLRLSPH